MFRKKYKILYLQSTSEIGGTDVTLLRTLRALDKHHFEPHVILHKEGPLAEPYRQAGAQVHFVPSMRKLTSRKGLLYLIQFTLGYLPAVFKISSIIKKHSIDLVHSNTIHNLYGFAAAFSAKKPHVWHIREIVVQSKWFAALEYFLVKNFSSRFIVMDQAIAAPFAGKNQGFSENIRKLYDGIDLEQFKPGKPSQDLRAELKIDPQIPLIGIVCRLDPWKGIDRFIEAAAKAARTVPNAKFWICGGEIEGHEGYETVLRKKAADLGIGAHVLFTGWRYQREQIADVYRSLTVSVQCPRHPEPYGLANLEAMACGVPAVAFDEGGPSELCREGALLVAPQSAEALAQGILKLLQDKVFADNLGRHGRQRAEALFDYKKCTAELETIYREILETKKI